MPQAIEVVINANLSVLVLTLTAALASAVAYTCGRYGKREHAKTEVQHALERAARDIRLMAENRTGAASGEFGRRALHEAEYIIRWRSAGDNYLRHPEGVSRLRPPDVPRSRHFRTERQRREIISLAFNNRPDDTYAGPVRRQMAARYNIHPDSAVAAGHSEVAS